MNWSDVLVGEPGRALRIIIVSAAAYAALLVILRLTGKRTLSKMNAFDLTVTVALGSTLATVILSKDVSLLEGILAFLLLAWLQLIVTWISVRSARFERWVKAEPRLLAYDGRLLRSAMRQERVTREEIESALREHGFASLAEVASVVLETNGSISVVGVAHASSGNRS